MITTQKIRSDLKEIGFYYSKQKELESASNTIVQSSALDKIAICNNAIKNAPLRLYDLYVSQFIINNSQAEIAEDWECSVSNIKRMSGQLYMYLRNALNE